MAPPLSRRSLLQSAMLAAKRVRCVVGTWVSAGLLGRAADEVVVSTARGAAFVP